MEQKQQGVKASTVDPRKVEKRRQSNRQLCAIMRSCEEKNLEIIIIEAASALRSEI